MKYYTYPDYMAHEPNFPYNSNLNLDAIGNNFTSMGSIGIGKFNSCLSKDGKYYIEIFSTGSSYRSGYIKPINDGIVPTPIRRGEVEDVVTYNTDSQTVSAQFVAPTDKYGYSWGISIREKRSVNDSASGLVNGTIYTPVLTRVGFSPNYENDDRFKTGPAPIATNGIQIVKYDSNNRPSLIAVTCFYKNTGIPGDSAATDRTITIEGVESPYCVKFYAIDWSGNNGLNEDNAERTAPLLNPLDIDVVETYEYQAASGETVNRYSMEPSKIIPDTENNLLYLVYNGDSPGADHKAETYESKINPRIVAVDISDISNPVEAARYDFPDINPIRNVDYDEDLSLLALCLRNNSNQNFDTIKILYYDKSSKSFFVRNTFTESAELDYSALNFGPKNPNTGQRYLYASNINSLTANNQDANRSNVGLHILRTIDNFQTMSKVKCYQTGSFWNDTTDIPLTETDIGYIPQPQYAPIFSKNIGNNLLYVMYNKYINPNSLAWTPDKLAVPKTSKSEFAKRTEHMCFSVLYDLALPESPTPIASHDHEEISYKDFLGGSTTTRTLEPTESSYDIFLASDDRSAGIIEIFELIPSSRHRGYGTVSLISKLQYTDRSDISLLSSYNFVDEVPFNVDYYSSHIDTSRADISPDDYPHIMHEFMCVANGLQGVKIYYWSNTSNDFKFLETLRPRDPDRDSQFENIKKVIVRETHRGANEAGVYAIGDKHIFNYKYTQSNNTFDLVQTVPLKDFITSDADDPTINTAEGLVTYTHPTISTDSGEFLDLIIEEHLPR